MAEVSALFSDRLAGRVRSGRGATPLITYYDLASGERTELSAITFANWVAKTANLLDELGGAAGDLVGLELGQRAPGHWVTFVWEAACWQVGAAVAAVRSAGPVAVTIVGPDWTGYPTSTASEIVACSLHPLGLGFPDGALPTGVRDYGVEARAQPDGYVGGSPAADALAWTDAERTLTQSDLVAYAGPPGRRLVRPSDPWTSCRDGLLAAVVAGGSAVVVAGDDDAAVARIADSEGVTP